MLSLLRSPKDFFLGCIYLALGAAALLIARNYPLGTASRMGPGYLPVGISILLMICGTASIIRSFLHHGEAIGRMGLKPLALILLSVAAFTALLFPVGLIGASVALILISAAASREFRLQWIPMLGALALVAFCCAVFVYGLGLPLPMVGSLFKV